MKKNNYVLDYFISCVTLLVKNELVRKSHNSKFLSYATVLVNNCVIFITYVMLLDMNNYFTVKLNYFYFIEYNEGLLNKLLSRLDRFCRDNFMFYSNLTT